MRKPQEKRPSRLAPLSVLPVFYKLEGKCALVVGGDDAAAWKAELLAAAGAKVRVVAPTLSSDFQHLVDASEGSYQVVARSWCADDVEDCTLAIGSFADEREAKRFTDAARACGTPVNVIDDPKYCDFQFGSIVNRSPVVVGVSTDGAAPAIAQLIRSKIETLLPASIADWAKTAKELRGSLREKMPDTKRRISFWREFAEAAFSKPASEISEFCASFTANRDSGVYPSIGKVTLVGAGPGDAGLLTLNALRALQAADVILFDDLVSDEVLDLSRREAKRMLVGKRGGRASCRQDDINETMLRLARQGKNVVRLKSGDPMIFGRAGEEIEMLEEAGVTVDVVPGVTSAIAAAARLKTSLTHRDCAQGVKFVTGHSRDGKLPSIDWKACADKETTLLVYMGARTAPLLAERLLSEGAKPATPVVIMSAVSRPNESVQRLTISQMQNTRPSTSDPVLIGIGGVFKARNAKVSGKTEHYMREACALRAPSEHSRAAG